MQEDLGGAVGTEVPDHRKRVNIVTESHVNCLVSQSIYKSYVYSILQSVKCALTSIMSKKTIYIM